MSTTFATYATLANITLTNAPFTNPGAGDFSIATAAKAELQAQGWPSSFLGISTNQHLDPGAAQIQIPTSTGGGGEAATAITECSDMALFKNVASQEVAVYAHDTANDVPKTGDSANITAQVSKDGGATAASNDTNPTELDATDAPGIYLIDLTQAESNCDLFILFAKSSTANIQLEPVIIYTLPGTNVGVSADVVKWVGDTPNSLIGGRVESIIGSFLIDESRVDAACTEAGQTQSFTTNLTQTEADYYAGWVFMFTDAGTNRAVPRVVRLYNGTTKEITLVTPLPANTTNGHAFALIALTAGAELTDGSMALNQGYTASAVLDAEQAGFLTAGTIGESINTAATKPTANENADALLKRDWTAVTGEAGRSVLNALRFLRNKWSVAGATLTVTKEDDATSAWTATVTTDAAADPVTGSDPA